MVNAKGITYAYNQNTDNILENISFDIQDGECIAVLGVNGAGKSTLLKCIDKILTVKSGIVEIDHQDLFQISNRKKAQHIAYVSQNSAHVDMNVFDTVMMGRKPFIKWDATKEDREIVSNAIHEMELDDYILRSANELSGGEVQRVMLARALAQQPRLLLLDEPTSNLDPRNQHEVLHTVRKIAKENNISVVIIIHDLNLAIRYCDKFLFLQNSQIYSYGGMETMTEKAIYDVYGIHSDIIYHKGIPTIIPVIDKLHRGE